MEILTPKLDVELLQQKANEYAFKGAEEAMKEFYTSYNSPYKKAIEENLKNKGVDNNFDIPYIIAVLNQKLSAEIDLIANTAISKTFVPLVKEFLTREAAEVKFSEILKKFIEYTDFEHNSTDPQDYTVEKVERDYGISLKNTFPVYRIGDGKKGFELHFYVNNEITTIMSMPYRFNDDGRYDRVYETKDKMRLSLDGGATLELPFVKGILEDDFMRYCARLVIGNTNIIFDVEDFDDEMFGEIEF